MEAQVLSSLSKVPMKILAGGLIIVMIALSVSYATSSPLAPTQYSSLAQTFDSSIPAGYLQSTVPISQQGELIKLLNQSLYTLPNNSKLYLPQEFYAFALLNPNPRNVNVTNLGQLAVLGVQGLDQINSTCNSYTLWWINGTGWYGISSLPSNFQAVKTQGDFSLYQLVPSGVGSHCQ